MGYDITYLLSKKEAAKLGMMRMNLYDSPKEGKWGEYNDRVINDPWVKSLIEAYKDRLWNCTSDTALDIALKPEWLENRGSMMDKVDGKTIDEVPDMLFTEEGR